MKQLSKSVIHKYIPSLTLKTLLGAFILFIYFIAWRPLRIAVAEQVVYPRLRSVQTDGAYQVKLKGNAILFHYHWGDVFKKLQYRPGFGFFFLISLIALLFINPPPKYYLMLVLLHMAASVFTYFGLAAGVSGTVAGFIFADIISAYLAPALSLMMVPIAASQP